MSYLSWALSFAFEQDDPDDPAKLYHKGVQLLTPLGATVYAPFEGEIAYAAPYRSFGNLAVIEHEGEGATLLSGLHSFAISVGDWVSQGAPLGLMSEQETPTPRLYFEFRILSIIGGKMKRIITVVMMLVLSILDYKQPMN